MQAGRRIPEGLLRKSRMMCTAIDLPAVPDVHGANSLCFLQGKEEARAIRIDSRTYDDRRKKRVFRWRRQRCHGIIGCRGKVIRLRRPRVAKIPPQCIDMQCNEGLYLGIAEAKNPAYARLPGKYSFS